MWPDGWCFGFGFFFTLLLCVDLIYVFFLKCLENSISHFSEDFNDLDVCNVEKILNTNLDIVVNSFCVRMLKLLLSLSWLFGGFLLLQVLLISRFNRFFNLD